jgi:hypothetical protein
MYLTYDDYQNMGGTLEKTAFVVSEFEAEAIINHYTFGRLKSDITLPDEVRMLTFKLLDLFQKRNESMVLGKSSNGESDAHITQQSNDGVSTSYNAVSATDLVTIANEEIKNCIHQYLDGVKNEAGRLVLYRGLYPNE